MFKKIALTSLACLSIATTASASSSSDVYYIKSFDHAISTSKILDDQNYRIGDYEARFVGTALMGSKHPTKKVDIRLRTLIEYYEDSLGHSKEVTRTVAAESCLNMANQLRLSDNNLLALKITVPSKSQVNPEENVKQYIVDHKDGDYVHHHMGFECELVVPPGPTTQFNGVTELSSPTTNYPTRY